MFATSAVVLWTKDRIILAADSLGKEVRSDGTNTVFGCKIHISKNYAFVAAGMTKYPDTAFDADVTIREAIGRSHSIVEAAMLADQIITPEFRQALHHMKKHYPKDYAKGNLGWGFLEFAIVGMVSKGQTGVAVRRLPAFERGKTLSDYFEIKDTEVGSRPLGPATSPRVYIQQHPSWYTEERSFVPIAKKLIGLAHQEAPSFVGGPTSILQIDDAGARWPEPGECT